MVTAGHFGNMSEEAFGGLECGSSVGRTKPTILWLYRNPKIISPCCAPTLHTVQPDEQTLPTAERDISPAKYT